MPFAGRFDGHQTASVDLLRLFPAAGCNVEPALLKATRARAQIDPQAGDPVLKAINDILARPEHLW